MGRLSQLFRNDSGISSPVGVLMMVILVIALAAIIGSIVFGHVNLFPKSAYIPVETQVKNTTSGFSYISVFHRNGDAAYLNLSGKNEGMPVYFQFTTPSGGTVRPLPDPSDGPETWSPGDTLFVYVNKTNGVWVTKNETRVAQDGLSLPQGEWKFDVVSKIDDVLIYTTKLGVGVLIQYTITASAGTNGNVTPAGVTTVNYGSTPTYAITPNSGYHVVNVLVNGTSVGVVTSYSFPSVTADKTISATFAVNTYTITASAGANGAVTPAGVSPVNYGATPTYAITPNPGYHVVNVLVNGTSVGAVTSYNFPSVTADKTISATFALNPTITNINPNSRPWYQFDRTVIITGTGFIGATSVTFDGTNVAYTVDSAGQITTTAPFRFILFATTVNVVITTPGGGTATGTYTYTW